MQIASLIANNLVTYNVPTNLNYFYNSGFLLAAFMVVQILTGIIVSIHYNFSFHSIVYILKEISVGWIFRYAHSMNCSLVHVLLIVHILRALYYMSYIVTANIYLSGLILYVLAIAVSFLGYVLPNGAMSYWGATVITNILALIPNLMELLLGNYVMIQVTLKRFYILHFLVSLIILVVMVAHIVYLHKLGSTNPLHMNTIKIGFYPYFYSKDLYAIWLVFIGLFLLYFNFIELSHSDNNIEINPLVTPLHIVPEWYFLSYYTVLKCINSKIAGILIMVSFFLLLFNVTNISVNALLTQEVGNLNIIMDWVSLFIIFLFIGAKLPLAIYLYLAKLLLVMTYGRNLEQKGLGSVYSYVTINPYFTLNGYSYYYSALNLILFLKVAIINANMEINESLINNTVLVMFIILSEALLFVSYFGILFDCYSTQIYINNFHLYYVGLLILCHASLISSALILFVLSFLFVNLQIIEYRNTPFTINHDLYTTIFYFCTSLHLIHVLIGVIMVAIVLYSSALFYSISQLSNRFIAIVNIRQYEYPVMVTMYWNFVETLWLLIFTLYSFFSNTNLNKVYSTDEEDIYNEEFDKVLKSFRNRNYVSRSEFYNMTQEDQIDYLFNLIIKTKKTVNINGDHLLNVFRALEEIAIISGVDQNSELFKMIVREHKNLKRSAIIRESIRSKFRSKELGSLNHKIIGFNYLIGSCYFGIVAILYSMMIRIELFSSANRIIHEQNNFIYNYLISLHGLMMIFFFVMPVVFSAFGNVYFPININSPELKLSKLNNLSFLLFLLSFITAASAAVLEFGIGVGWTLVPPLSTYSINLSKSSLELTLIALIFNGLASLISSINFFVSLFYMMNVFVINLISVFSVATLLCSLMLILSLPVLTCAIVSLAFDIICNTVLYDSSFGADPVFYQHCFWFFGHPEVYVIVLPSFGIFNTVLMINTQKATFGLASMNLAMVGITFLGFTVWAHHMYVAGMESDTRAYFTAVTIMISIPTGTKVFNWLANFYCFSNVFLQMNSFYLFFLAIFIVGGVSGIILGNASVDVMLHDTYYVVGHFHQVLAVASVLAMLMLVLEFNEDFHFLNLFSNVNSSNISFLFTNFSFHVNLLFINMIFLGFNVLPRRIPDYADESIGWNVLATINAIAIMLLLILML